MDEITPQLLLTAYAQGLFPMADSADAEELFWLDPPLRGVLPLDGFHVPRKLRRTIRQRRFELRFDSDFVGVLRGCAEATADRPRTWINGRIRRLYDTLHRLGRAHSVECWQDGALVGGLYGVALKGAFFGESMFSRATDASKVALVHLVAQLRSGGFVLLDSQFMTEHLRQFGGVEVPRAEYKRQLRRALTVEARWPEQVDWKAVEALLAGPGPGDPAPYQSGPPEEAREETGRQEPVTAAAATAAAAAVSGRTRRARP